MHVYCNDKIVYAIKPNLTDWVTAWMNVEDEFLGSGTSGLCGLVRQIGSPDRKDECNREEQNLSSNQKRQGSLIDVFTSIRDHSGSYFCYRRWL